MAPACGTVASDQARNEGEHLPSAKTSKQRAQERTAQLRAERRRERRRNLLLGTASTVAATIIGAVRPDACPPRHQRRPLGVRTSRLADGHGLAYDLNE